MTEKQHRWYLREWSKAWRAHWAGTRRGEILARPDRKASALREEIVAIARRLAGCAPLSADLVRHACHVRAIGTDKGSWALTNKQIDLVVTVFRQLADDTDLTASMRIDAADREADRLATPPSGMPDADRKRLLWSMEHLDLPAAYKEQLCRDKHGTGNWRSLSDADLYKLLLTAKVRASSRAIAGSKKASLCNSLS